MFDIIELSPKIHHRFTSPSARLPTPHGAVPVPLECITDPAALQAARLQRQFDLTDETAAAIAELVFGRAA